LLAILRRWTIDELGWSSAPCAAAAAGARWTWLRVLGYRRRRSPPWNAGTWTPCRLPTFVESWRHSTAGGDFDIRWRGGNLDRTLDERHARLIEAVVDWLTRHGWRTEVEVTYSIYGERGSIDVLAFHPPSASLLVIEVKTEINSIEETLRRHDEKVRLGPRIARARFGWQASNTSRILVLGEHRSARRHVVAHHVVLDSAMPEENVAVRRWLTSPVGSIRGRWFLPYMRPGGIRREPGGPDRVRTPDPPARRPDGAQTQRDTPGS